MTAASPRHLGPVLAALRPRARGGMIIALEREFALVDEDWSVRALGGLWADPGVRMNDGGCDPDGRFYCGSMAYDSAPGRAACTGWTRTGASRRPRTRDGLQRPGLIPDRSTAYYVDSATQRVDALTTPGAGPVRAAAAVKVDRRPGSRTG